MKWLHGRFPMAWIATVATLVPIIVAGALLLYFAVRTTRHVSDALGEQVMAEASQRVESSVGDYLHHAERVSDLYADLLLTGVLNDENPDRWRISMLANLRNTPEVAAIGYANAADDYVYYMRFPPELEYGYGRGGPNGTTMHAWEASLEGELLKPARPDSTFKVRERPWYQIAVQSPGPTWTPAYTWFARGSRPSTPVEFSVAYTRAIHEPKTGRFMGVLAVDTLLTRVNTTLRELAAPIDALLVITDGDGGLIGASDLGPGVTTLPPGRHLRDIPNAVAQALAEEFDGVGKGAPGSLKPGHITVNGQRYWTSRTRLARSPTTQWYATIAIPERSILAPVQTGVHWMIVVGTVFIAVEGIVSVAFARILARPLQQLAVFAQTVGTGDFGARIDIGTSGEMVELSDALNGMARSLHERVQLLAQRDAAQQATTAKSRLVAHVSHEFRTPLNAIIGYAELLRDQAQSADRQTDAADAANILTASQHLLALVENLLDLSSIDAGRLRLEWYTFSISRLLDDVAIASRPVVERNRNRLDVIAPNIDAQMRSDPTRVRQILINLTGNAGKFTHDGRVTLSAEIDETNRRVKFEVTDTGPGIADERLPDLFEPFAYVPAAGNVLPPGTGAGLGLAITRQLCHALGGNIEVETGSTGTLVRVTLPLETAAAPDHASPGVTPSGT